MTPAMLRTLREMRDAEKQEDFEDAQIVCSGIECWLGLRCISRRTVYGLLRLMVIKPCWESATEYFEITGTGRSVLERPELEHELQTAILVGKPFTITNEHKIELI